MRHNNRAATALTWTAAVATVAGFVTLIVGWPGALGLVAWVGFGVGLAGATMAFILGLLLTAKGPREAGVDEWEEIEDPMEGIDNVAPAAPATAQPPARPAPPPAARPRPAPAMQADPKAWPDRRGGPAVGAKAVPRHQQLAQKYTQNTPLVRGILSGGGQTEVFEEIPEVTAVLIPPRIPAGYLPDGHVRGRCGKCEAPLFAPSARPVRLRCPKCSKTSLLR